MPEMHKIPNCPEICPSYDIFTQVRIIDDLPNLDPDITWPQWMVVSLTLVVVPSTLKSLIRAKTSDINAKIASATKAPDLFVRADERSGPLLYKFFPIVWTKSPNSHGFRNRDAALHMFR